MTKRNSSGNYELPNGLLIVRPFERSADWTLWRVEKWRIEQIDSGPTFRAVKIKAKGLK